ncbi:Stf0 sulfotransferase [compost metagenome]
MRLTYEVVTANPQKALGGILGRLGLDPAVAKTLPTPTAKMADGLSAEWVARFQREAGKV